MVSEEEKKELLAKLDNVANQLRVLETKVAEFCHQEQFQHETTIKLVEELRREVNVLLDTERKLTDKDLDVLSKKLMDLKTDSMRDEADFRQQMRGYTHQVDVISSLHASLEKQLQIVSDNLKNLPSLSQYKSLWAKLRELESGIQSLQKASILCVQKDEFNPVRDKTMHLNSSLSSFWKWGLIIAMASGILGLAAAAIKMILP